MTLKGLKINNLFYNEDIKIAQCIDQFKYSLDSLLLAKFVKLKTSEKRLLEVGTNNAVIPAIIHNEISDKLLAIEINKDAIPFANKTLELNNIKNVETMCIDYNEFVANNIGKKFDHIFCNPPYFDDSNHGKQKQNKFLANARHQNDLSIESFIELSAKIIENKGKLTFVYRPEKICTVLALLDRFGFAVKRKMYCHPKQGKNANLVLIEAVFKTNPGLVVEPAMICHNEDGSYSKQLLDFLGGQHAK